MNDLIVGVVAVVAGINLLIGFHELGHFLACLVTKTAMDEFSIGIGPKIYSCKRMGMMFSLRAFLIGGYVKISTISEDIKLSIAQSKTSTVELPKARDLYFENKSSWAKLLIILMGPAFSFLLAPVLMITSIHNTGITQCSINSITSNSAAASAGLMPADTLLYFDGRVILNKKSLRYFLDNNTPCQNVCLTIKRESEELYINVVPQTVDGKQELGITLEEQKRFLTLTESVKFGLLYCHTFFWENIYGLKKSFSGKEKTKMLIGPIGISKIMAKVANQSIGIYLIFLAGLTMSIGIFNLFPIPPLDGGQALILALEAITGRKAPEKVVYYISVIIFTLLISITILVSYKELFMKSPLNLQL